LKSNGEWIRKKEGDPMSTTAIEIPKETWAEYFKDIAKQYGGWAVSIELLDRQLGDQRAMDGLPFQGISYEYKGGSQAGDILIEAGDKNLPFETHLVHRPKVVRAVVTQPGAETDIEIESEEEGTTLVHLRMRPELPPPK
jgi:hypothetical protein